MDRDPEGKVSRISENEMKQMQKNGFEPHDEKPKQGGKGGKIDLYKDSKGYIFYKTEKGNNYTYINDNIINYK